MKIAVVGAGYVGLSIAALLSQNYEVYLYEIRKEKVEKINKKISPIKDEYIEKYFKEKNLNLIATTNYKKAFSNAKYIIICTPTNYDEETNKFNTSSIENIIEKVISLNIKSTIVIKSTIPVGYIETIKNKYNINNIFFVPEFLREGYALYDNLHPARIIIGSKSKEAVKFANLLKQSCLNKKVPIKYLNLKEAESVKLFSNTYLAMRISFFNELDTYAEINDLNTKDIIEGVCLDNRIGNYYNNPSFGYGGYCLPKDTKQLLSSYKNVPQNLIGSIIKSNKTRKTYIINMILSKNIENIGIYRLTMKAGSDNYRESAVLDIINCLLEHNIKIIIYEPEIKKIKLKKVKLINEYTEFIEKSELIVANRIDDKIKKTNKIIYTRDLFNKD